MSHPTHTELFAEFAQALQDGYLSTVVNTPNYRKAQQTLGEVLADDIDPRSTTLELLARILGLACKSTDVLVRVEAMAACAQLARSHADYHALAAEEASDDDNGAADSWREMEKDARMFEALSIREPA